MGARVAAVSVDPPKYNRAFARKIEANFPVLSDPGMGVIDRYGVARGDVARRVTFVLDPEGVVRAIDQQVQISRHGKDIVARVKAMQAKPDDDPSDG